MLPNSSFMKSISHIIICLSLLYYNEISNRYLEDIGNTVCKKIIRTPYDRFVETEISERRKNIFLTLIIPFDRPKSLVYFTRKTISFNTVCQKFWKIFNKPLHFLYQKNIRTLYFFCYISFILHQNILNYTSFDRENISLHDDVV